jgi:hypothetical protein
MMSRRALVSGLLLAAVAVPLAAAPASAAAFTAVSIQGEGVPDGLDVRDDADPELFAAMLGQVSWLSSRPGQTTAPAKSKLGPKYTVVVFTKDVAKQTYDLYPLAAGGPRVFRPAKQPDRRATTSAWFYGRLNMSETLRIAGVPLPVRADALSGGIGGGDGEVTDDSLAEAEDIQVVFAEWRRLFLLNGAVVLLIAAGLAGFALLIRTRP